MIAKVLFLHIICFSCFAIAQNPDPSEITISGFTYDSISGAPLEGAGVFFYRYRDDVEVVTHSDAQGHYSISIPSGNYVVRVLKFGYLAPLRRVYQLTDSRSDLDFAFTLPVFRIDRDSIDVTAEAKESVNDSVVVENTGSGQLFFSAAPAVNDEDLILFSKSSVQPIIPKMMKILVFDMQEQCQIEHAAAPTDSLWRLVHHDAADNAEGTLDIHETWMQVKDDQLYCKVTFYHHIKAAFRQFEYTLQLDTDGDRNTGADAGWEWIGADYTIAISDFGQGPMAILARWDYNQWRLVQRASYSNLGTQTFVCGFPLALFKNLKILSFMSSAFNLTNDEADIDYVPEYNTGFLVYSTRESSGLIVEPRFAELQPGEKDTVIITMRPEYFAKGFDKSYILFICNQPMKPIRVIPIILKNHSGVAESQQTEGYRLEQNYPNPFNPTTMIKYSIPFHGLVTLKVYNIAGQFVRNLVHRYQNEGTFQVEFDAAGLSAGIYYYQLQAGNFRQVRKLVLVR
jgi:hypothetical protein